MLQLTQHVAVLGKEGGVRPEVDTTADHVKRAKLGAVLLPRCRITEYLSVIAMVRIRVWLPARYSTQGNLRAGESDTYHSAILASVQAASLECSTCPSFPLDITVAS